ncbi:MAG: Rpn family recombination-promoting nuclease/putative transposase [Lachnospiraceae bacterium]
MKQKKLEDLTISNNFMFGAVMSENERCRRFVEMVLGISIAYVEVSKEKSLIYHPEYKGVRLDVYAKDENNTHYDIEMQVAKKPALGKRSRYYHSHLDMELLEKSTDYTKLANAFVIFVCDFDPFGGKKYRYRFRSCCEEDRTLLLDDGCETIFLSTCGENETEVPKELVKFMKFVKADLKESQQDFDDELVKIFQEAIQSIKASREMRGRYMIFEEMMRDERNEGRQEGIQEGILLGKLESSREAILDLLGELGEVPGELVEMLEAETDLLRLKALHRAAFKSASITEFMEKYEDLRTSEKK